MIYFADRENVCYLNDDATIDPPRPFDFLVEGQLLRAPLHKLLVAEGVSAESVLTVEYMPAVLPPTSNQQCPHDDWLVPKEVFHVKSPSFRNALRYCNCRCLDSTVGLAKIAYLTLQGYSSRRTGLRDASDWQQRWLDPSLEARQ
jgi:hypothetical protein